MIAAKTTHVLESTIQGDAIEMSIDQDALAKLMKILTDLYSNRPLACIREISTNALDAHLEVGNTDPIRVTLPTPLDPYLRIKDFGPGLDAADIRDTYSKYGKSTRSATNNAVGMMGLGCKAPLTYTSSYTVVGIKDGVKYTTLISRNEDGVGSMTVVGQEPTTDPSSVAVEIMVGRNDIGTFRNEAVNFFRFWDEGTVLLDGQEPQRIEGTNVGANMLIVKGDTDYVVMGNVPYPIKRRGYGTSDNDATLDHGLNHGWALVVRVPIGAVSIPPSREALMDDSHTKDALRAIETNFHAAIAKSIQRDINACNSPFGAVRAMAKWQSILPKSSRPSFGNYTFRGRTIPDSIDLPEGTIGVPHSTSVLSRSYAFNKLAAEKFDKVIIFTDWKFAGFTPTMRRKLDKWAADKDMRDGGYEYVLTPASEFTSHWFDSAMVFPWDEVKSIKLTDAEASAGGRGRWRSGRIPGSFDVYQEGVLKIGYPAGDIDQDEDVFYFNGNKWQARGYADMTIEFPNSTLVCVPDNRLNKFKRDFPGAQSVAGAAKVAADAWAKTINPDDVVTAALIDSTYHSHMYSGLDLSRIEDPAVAEFAKLFKRDVSEYKRKLAFYSSVAYSIKVPEVTIPDNPLPSKYPLLFANRYSRPSLDAHAYAYMNLMYEARKSGLAVD